MKTGVTRWTGGGLLLLCMWWWLEAAGDLAVVSPIHWGLILPQLGVGAVPALVGTLTAGALIFGRPGARALVFALFFTLLQAVAVTVLAPDLQERYSETVQQSEALRTESGPAAR